MTDEEVWLANPSWRWVYDKLRIAETAGVTAAPLGIDPPSFPVVVKPVINLYGMGRGARLVQSGSIPYEPGYMWCEALTGRHVSVDMRLDDGIATWTTTSIGHPGDRFGRFSRWDLLPAPLGETFTARTWACTHMRGYTGPLNVELIGGKIIEVHLRLTQDWIDAGVYGSNDTDPPQPATLVPEWSDDTTQGDNGRVGYTVTRI